MRMIDSIIRYVKRNECTNPRLQLLENGLHFRARTPACSDGIAAAAGLRRCALATARAAAETPAARRNGSAPNGYPPPQAVAPDRCKPAAGMDSASGTGTPTAGRSDSADHRRG